MIRQVIGACALLVSSTAVLGQGSPLVDRPSCTRAELEVLTASYISGQAAGDISALNFHPEVQLLENMQPVSMSEGLWNTALPISHEMSFHDPVRCKTFTEFIVTDGDHQYVVGTRLYLHEGKVLRVDSLVTDQGDWLFNANAYQRYASREDWSTLHPYQRTPAAEMIRGANAYLDAFSDKFTSPPWGIPCARLEGGAYTNRDSDPAASCEVGIPAGILYIVNRDYLIDEEKGVINVYCRFGNSSSGMPDSHTFRYINGRFRYVHTLSVNLGSTPSPQADDLGNIIRN